MPPEIVYGLSPGQLEQEAKRSISVSKAMQTASRFVRKRQTRVAELNKEYRDRSRKDVSFKSGDLVWKFDRSADAHGPKKYQFRFSGPHIVQNSIRSSANLYSITHCQTRKVQIANVDVLVPVCSDCGDLGLPFGWPEDKPKATPNQTLAADSAKMDITPSQGRPPLRVGDMVAIEVAPDTLEKMPFAVGQVITLSDDGSDSMTVWWYGNGYGNPHGAWRPGYYDPKDNHRYYSTRRQHTSHPRYTNMTSETVLTTASIIGTSFHLNRRDGLPYKVLLAASENTSVSFSVSEEQASAFLASPCTCHK
jgi:hypothetical protein